MRFLAAVFESLFVYALNWLTNVAVSNFLMQEVRHRFENCSPSQTVLWAWQYEMSRCWRGDVGVIFVVLTGVDAIATQIGPTTVSSNDLF